jgi:hypothetical protein
MVPAVGCLTDPQSTVILALLIADLDRIAAEN